MATTADGLGCRGPRGYDMGNLMALCAQHHSPISAQQRWAGEPVHLPRRNRLLSFCSPQETALRMDFGQ
jgi:hypothetical protein